ncbi:ferritin-like domain-containing protein [Geopsychrobacter electrodiphilus]|uniref:ferritin-like domain-containing protein n=1 Tax=Geopsychrobacter electrodiphilus TaxID=225196 RepID=UPI00035F2B02|nr:ferritin family protein [Geopsychrobacter electrodiphilus]
MDDKTLKDALRKAIQTEKDAMDFYTMGAAKIFDEKAKATFEILAREERQHARSFYNAYNGDDFPAFEVMMADAPDTGSSWYLALQKAMLNEFDERLALELAIEQEDLLAKSLLATAATIDDPKIKQVYLTNAASTHHHLEMVEADYRAMLGMGG